MPAAESTAILEARGIWHQFSTNSRKLFSGLDLKLKSDEFISILGPSGCGKSTLLRILAELIQPTKGQVHLKTDRRAFVFQEPRLLPWKTVTENASLPIQIQQSLDPSRVKQSLEKVNLLAAENQFPHEISGGMKMRTSLARALVTNPEIVFFDEPFSALDEQVRFNLQDFVTDLSLEQKWSGLFVTHSLQEALVMSDQVLILDSHGQKRDLFVLPPRSSRTAGWRNSKECFELTQKVRGSL